MLIDSIKPVSTAPLADIPTDEEFADMDKELYTPEEAYELTMKDIKKAIGMLKGVGNVTVPRRKRISAYERSLQELEEGRVYEAKDVDDLFKQCLG